MHTIIKKLATICLESYRGKFSGNVIFSIDINGVQASIIDEDNYCILVFRGSDERKDWEQDLKFNFVNTVYGKMHKGFKQSWDLVSSEIRKNLPNKPLYITGHSYGGALAFISGIYIPHLNVVTFGCPRVMHKNYFNYLKINHLRVRNNNDIVTMLPPKFLGYTHVGELLYLDYNGNKSNKINLLDKAKSHIKAWSKGQKFNAFYDHDINKYIEKL
jgi:predicted lipase